MASSATRVGACGAVGRWRGGLECVESKIKSPQHRGLGTVKMGRVHPFVVNMTGYWHVGQNFKTTIDINDIYIYTYICGSMIFS